MKRWLPIGAEPGRGGVHFRVWAPHAGGGGAPDDVEGEAGWRVPGWTAVVLRPAPHSEQRKES